MVTLLVLLAVVVQLLDGIPLLEYALTLTFTMFDSENVIINWFIFFFGGIGWTRWDRMTDGYGGY